ncbi:hypothetical protein COV18_00520 [Candidatus Woesearchaeota archaeon CG10_big_fil_rev_8_21_14_0_10_37_12]|nr:MAG: hypothetical protein COV18_00520 [Candidatus Woesearchaeota archaeon CG10_big_fil_rev_8_21_14_0_10_37_12]
MFLYFKQGLEDIVSLTKDIAAAIYDVKTEQLEDFVASEKMDFGEGKISDDLIETLMPVVEQNLDPVAYEPNGIAYEIGVSYSSTEPIQGYYEKIMNADANKNTSSASFSTMYSQYEHDQLGQAQNIAFAMKEATYTNRVAADTQIDANLRHVKNQFKTLSIGIWYLMYEGKLQFN